MPFSYHSKKLGTKVLRVDIQVTSSVTSPGPEVTAMIHSHSICGHYSAFKRIQNCPNRLRHLRETDVSLMEVDPKIKFPIISPEPEVAAIIRLHLFNAPIVLFE